MRVSCFCFEIFQVFLAGSYNPNELLFAALLFTVFSTNSFAEEDKGWQFFAGLDDDFMHETSAAVLIGALLGSVSSFLDDVVPVHGVPPVVMEVLQPGCQWRSFWNSYLKTGGSGPVILEE